MLKLKNTALRNQFLLLFGGWLLLGIAQLTHALILALPAIAILIYGLLLVKSDSPRKLYWWLLFGNAFYMSITTSWYRHITATEWANIGPFGPQTWIMIIVSVGVIFSSIVPGLLLYLTPRLIKSLKLSPQGLIAIYIWSLCLMLVEIVSSIGFSIFTHTGSSPIAPTWNMYSVATLVSGTPLNYVGRTFGFWGTSFCLYLLGGLVAYTLVDKKCISRHAIKALLIATLLLVISFGSSRILFAPKPAGTLRVIAVHQANNDDNYLQTLAAHLPRHASNSTVVVLPEYSNLLHPDTNAFGPSLAYDARYTYPAMFQGSNVYFSGTEAEFYAGNRYVETYIVNSKLQKIKREEKTFLIPGGEYIMPWLVSALREISPHISQDLAALQSRTVAKVPLEPETKNVPIARQVGVGACSTILLPYHYRQEVQSGAELLTANVSYEEFSQAPQYERLANYFASFIAQSTARPFAIGARNGEAVLYSPTGKKLQSTGQDYLTANVKLATGKTVYDALGDTLIILLVALPAIGLGVIRLINSTLRLKQIIEK